MESSPSLKLKIKLGPNMKAESFPPRTTTTKEEEDTNPLKIIIKKSDLSSPAPHNTLPSNDKVTLTLLPFPNVANKPLFKKACACTSFEQLEKWNEKELTLLGEELESMRKCFKDFSSALQIQLETLETWRQKSDPSKKKSENPNSFFPPNNSMKVAPSPNLGSPTSLPEKPPKSKSKKVNKKRKSQDSSSGDDPSFSVNAKESSDSASDDEIDVVDIEENAADPDADVDAELKTKSKAANQDYTPSKSQKNKLAMMIRKRNSGGGSRGRNKTNRISRQSTRERKKSRKGEELDSSAEEISGKGKWPNNNFWRDMEPFFSSFTNDDAKFCAIQTVDMDDDPAFQIPPLGKHYSDDYDQDEDEEYYEPIRTRSREVVLPKPQENGTVENNDSNRNPSCGDLTARILSALMEENLIPPEVQMTSPSESEMNGNEEDVTMTDANHNEPPSIIKETIQDEGLPLETPPTYDYSHNTMLSLEDRIKLELKSIGLLDDQDLDFDSNSREDDEICSELRKLQKELKEQMMANNAIRTKVSELVADGMAKEEASKKDKANYATLEKAYLKMMKKKKRKPVAGKMEPS